MKRFKIGQTCFLFILMLSVFLITGCGGGGGGGNEQGPQGNPDIAPTVSSTIPADLTADAATNGSITASFSEAMDPLTITAATFTLTDGIVFVPSGVTYVGTVAVLNPTSDLIANTTYTATITTGAKDLTDHALASNYVWSFTTGAGTDTTAPTVSSIIPADLATDVIINGNISATFSEGMNPLTITTTTFTLKQSGVTPVLCAVMYVGTVATLNPTSNLAANTTYTATIATGAEDLAGNALAGDYVWNFTTGAGSDTIAPTVSSTIPADLAVGTAINGDISATFSEGMDPLTITTATFSLKQGATPVPGTVTYVGTVATLNPTSNLAADTTYTATIATGARDLAGNALAVAKTWSFTTGAASDIIAPTVSSTLPGDLSTGVAINGKISAFFSEGMDPLTITTTTFTLMDGITPVPGTVTYVGTVATFDPTGNLAVGTTYTATITTGAKDLSGNALAVDKTWNFTTGAASDLVAPTVSSTIPTDLAVDVAINGNITATFDEGMDPLTITTATFILAQGATPVLGAVTYVGTVATFNPTSDLAANTTYTATITAGAKDLSGNALASDYVWSFTTGGSTAAGPPPVNLGTAGNFVILSKAGITNVPNSAVTGDMGVSPIDSTAITGFTLAMDVSNTFSTDLVQVTGKIYAADYTSPTPSNLTTAISNMETAYTDAAGRPTPDFINLGAGDISGLTLVPGLYKWGIGVLISSDITLNGGPNDVWIFQISGDLTVDPGAKVLLAGGALPKNIFWQCFGAVALDTTTHLEGIVLCQTLISLNTGATVNGRLLSQTAVTLDQNTVVQPAP